MSVVVDHNKTGLGRLTNANDLSKGYIKLYDSHLVLGTALADEGLNNAVTTTGSAAFNTPTSATASGIIQLTTGAGSGGGMCIYTFVTAMQVPTVGKLCCQYLITIPTLFDGTDDGTLYCGFGDVTSTHDQTDGFGFLYERAASVNWTMVASGGGSRTETASSVAVGTGHTLLQASYDAATATVTYSVKSYPSGAWQVLGTVSGANVPTTSEMFGAVNVGIYKSAGTGPRTVEVDAIRVWREL